MDTASQQGTQKKKSAGLSEDELTFWAKRLNADAAEGREMYVYFNNDPEGYAVHDALRLRELLGSAAVPPT